MAFSFFSFPPFRQTNTTPQPSPPFSRTMASGRCTAVGVFGRLPIPCPCPRGEFEAPLTTLDIGCKVCTHPLSQHEDASSTLVPDSLPLPQGIASSINSVHFISVMSLGAVNDIFWTQPILSLDVRGKLRSLHSGISLKNISLFTFEAHLPAGNLRWLYFSKIT